MGKVSAKIPNSLRLYRRKNGLSQKDIARLLGYKSSTTVSSYEQGAKSPQLVNLLKLEIINRVPVAYLYWDCYRTLRQEIRRKEELLRSLKGGEVKC
jgi:transcriptional regulator with XRE-family HTH domain